MVFRYVAHGAAAMKLSQSNSQSQGENNRETCPTDPRCSYSVPQHFSDSNRSPRRWRRRNGHELRRRPDLQAVGSATELLCTGDRPSRTIDSRSYENRTRVVETLRPAASRGIVMDRNAAGALIPLELPLGSTQYISSRSWIDHMEARLFSSVSRLFCVCYSKRRGRPCGFPR